MNKNIRDFFVALFILIACLFSFYGIAYFTNINSNTKENVKKVKIKDKKE